MLEYTYYFLRTSSIPYSSIFLYSHKGVSMAKHSSRKQNSKYNTISDDKWQVIIPVTLPTQPEPHELSAAHILAKHFQCTVEFLTPIDDYKRKTPDFKMLGIYWELKSPVSSSKNAIINCIKRAAKQSQNIVMDIRRSKFNVDNAASVLKNELVKRQSLKRILLISKEKVVEILK